MAFPTDVGFVFALTYGRDVDWVKNLLASDSGSLEYDGTVFPVHSFSFIAYDEVKDVFPFWIRLLLHILSVEDCLLAERQHPGLKT